MDTYSSTITPARRFMEARDKFDRAYQNHFNNRQWLPEHPPSLRDASFVAVFAFIPIRQLRDVCQKLASVAAIIERENAEFCRYLSGIAAKRQQRWRGQQQACCLQTTTTSTTINTSEPPSSSSSTFPKFAKLPAELQLMIWEAAAAESPSCKHVLAIWMTARAPSRKEMKAKGGAVKMRGAHGCDPVSLLLLEDNLGLWYTCRASRAAIRRVYAETYAEAYDSNNSSGGGSRSSNSSSYRGYLDISPFARQCRHYGRFNRLAIEFKSYVQKFEWCVRTSFPDAENQIRKVLHHNDEQLQLHLEQAETTHERTYEGGGTEPSEMVQDGQNVHNRHNVFADAMREFYELNGDLPQGPDDGPMPLTTLKRLCPEMRIGYLLGVPWG